MSVAGETENESLIIQMRNAHVIVAAVSHPRTRVGVTTHLAAGWFLHSLGRTNDCHVGLQQKGVYSGSTYNALKICTMASSWMIDVGVLTSGRVTTPAFDS